MAGIQLRNRDAGTLRMNTDTFFSLSSIQNGLPEGFVFGIEQSEASASSLVRRLCCFFVTVSLLCMNDYLLIEKDASEWAIAHRLAVYLEQIVPGWHVDCEYNRQSPGTDPKVNPASEIVRPDVVLHHREKVEREHNLLVIELKKQNTDADSGKVRDYTSAPAGKRKFQYQYGLTLSFQPRLEGTWFQGGQEI